MPTTAAQQVRLITGLTADELPDASIDIYLEINDDAVKLAAADALETFASQLTSVTSDDISLDGSKRAKTLLDRAARLREQHTTTAAGEEFMFDVTFDGCSAPELAERGYC